MRGLLFFVLTLGVAALGSFAAQKLKIPGGGMLGAMIAVAALNLLSGEAVFPEDLRVAVQICSGAMVGSRISRKDAIALKQIVLPTVLLIAFMMLMNMTIGVTIFACSDLDIATSLFAASPGGMSDMALIAEDMGANSVYVTLLQLIRLITVLVFMPAMVRWIHSKNKKKAGQKETIENKIQPQPLKTQVLRCFVTVFVAGTGGLLFYFMDVTAGAMLGAMLFTATYNMLHSKAYFPPKIRAFTQVFAGAFLGMRIDMESVLGIGRLLIPAAIMVAGILLFTFVAAFLIHKFTKLDLGVCLMACTPGGIQEMSILSEDLGTDTPKIAVMQTARLISVIALFPTMIEIIAKLFMH